MVFAPWDSGAHSEIVSEKVGPDLILEDFEYEYARWNHLTSYVW